MGSGRTDQFADIAKEMGLTKGRVSQLATQLIKAGKLRKRKN
jgi:DNA-binding MarR family transcriptional regulator